MGVVVGGRVVNPHDLILPHGGWHQNEIELGNTQMRWHGKLMGV